MSEAIIARGGGVSRSEVANMVLNSIGANLITTIIDTNTIWTVPTGIVGDIISVRIFGGGGGPGLEYRYGSSDWQVIVGGGGSGEMNNGDILVKAGQLINITIGDGGTQGQSGGTTSFGNYLSAPGGESGKPNGDGGNGGAGGFGGNGGIGYQFGGGGGWIKGGDAKIWGGGGGAVGHTSFNANKVYGGNGGIYGGGGGSYTYDGWRNGNISYYGYGGNGGKYGGGGGGWFMGYGGEYGGNGGSININAEDGTNTITWTNIEMDANGNYINGNGLSGILKNEDINNSYLDKALAGGGGFGGNGSTGWVKSAMFLAYIGGGGGGYGMDGAGGNFGDSVSTKIGGGGYGKISHNLGSLGGGGYFSISTNFGGAGYMTNCNTYGGAGYMNYGSGGYNHQNNYFNGKSGVCIIQYYAKSI